MISKAKEHRPIRGGERREVAAAIKAVATAIGKAAMAMEMPENGP